MNLSYAGAALGSQWAGLPQAQRAVDTCLPGCLSLSLPLSLLSPLPHKVTDINTGLCVSLPQSQSPWLSFSVSPPSPCTCLCLFSRRLCPCISPLPHEHVVKDTDINTGTQAQRVTDINTGLCLSLPQKASPSGCLCHARGASARHACGDGCGGGGGESGRTDRAKRARRRAGGTRIGSDLLQCRPLRMSFLQWSMLVCWS